MLYYCFTFNRIMEITPLQFDGKENVIITYSCGFTANIMYSGTLKFLSIDLKLLIYP